MRKFHSDPSLQKFAAQWDAATPNMKGLPDRLNAAQSAAGKLKGRQHFAAIAQNLASKKKIAPHLAQLAGRVVHGQETASGEKAESPAMQRSEGAKGEKAESGFGKSVPKFSGFGKPAANDFHARMMAAKAAKKGR